MPSISFTASPITVFSATPRRLHSTAATTTTTTSGEPSPDFIYNRSIPSIRWPNLNLTDYSPSSPLPLPPIPQSDPPPDPNPNPDPNPLPAEPLDSKRSRTRAKKLNKLALKRAKDWRQRVELLSGRILALNPSEFVADILDSRAVQMTPTDLCFVVKTVGHVSWRRSLEVFEWLTLHRRHSPGPRLLATILSVLGRARQTLLAEELFARCADPESNPSAVAVQVYNAMMGVYARAARFNDVQKLLEEMKSRSIAPDLVSFNTLINAKAKAGLMVPGSARELLQQVRNAGLRPDTITFNTLISACSHSLSFSEAVEVFESMEASKCQPDLWTYNGMVSVYARCGMARDARRVFDELSQRGFSPDAVTYNALLYAFARDGDVEEVERVCEQMVKAGFKKDEITYNTMIHMYGKMGMLDLVVELYREMREDGCSPDAVTYTVLIDSLGKADKVAEAERVMGEMVEAGVRPTLRAYSALICGYAKAGMRDEAVHTFELMRKSGIKPDNLAYSVMVDILLRSNDVRKAMVLYREMMRDGFRPDKGLYGVMLGVLAKESKDEEIREVVRDMEESGFSSKVILSILVKGECFFKAAEVLKHAVDAGFEPERENLFSIMNAFVSSGRHAEMHDLLNFLKESAPNSQTLIAEAAIFMLCKDHQTEAAIAEYNEVRVCNFESIGASYNMYESLIICCEETEFFHEASQIFSDMKFLGLEPSWKIYESVINIFCKMGFPETSHHLVNQAERAGIAINLSIYVNLIETYGRLKMWQRAESIVEDLRLRSLVDRKIWNALINAYAANGLYEQARAIFNTMMKDGIQPTIDSVNGLMQALIVDGRLDELYVVVQELQDMDFKISKSTVLMMLDAYARVGNIFEVKKIYNGMKAAGYLPTMHLYRSMLALLCRGKRVRDVELMLAEMEGIGFKPDLSIFNSLLKMYTGVEDFKKTVETYRKMQEAGYKPDEDTYNTLIVMYSRDRRPEEGFSLLNDMKKQGLEPKMDTYKSLLAACAKEQLWEQAEELFENMRSKVCIQDRLIYHIMMKIYRDSGDHSKAENVLSLMKEAGVQPSLATMHLLMVSYGSGGQPQEAENILNNLKASGMELSTLPFSSVIDAYLKKGDYNMGITKLLEMKRDGVEPDHRIWTCFIRAASRCEQTDDAMLLLNALQENGFDMPIRLLTEKADSLIVEVDRLLEDLGPMEDNAAFNFVNAVEDLLWAFERRATASWVLQLAIKKSIYRHNLFRVAEKDWGADFRKLSGGAALVALTLWLDLMQDASLQGIPESPKSVVLITGGAEYNMVSLNRTLKAYLWEMGSPFLPCKTRDGLLVAKAHSLRMWLKDSSFCLDLELKDAISLPKTNSMKLTDGYFMRAGLVQAFNDIHEQLGQVRPKKFAQLALLPKETRDKVVKTQLERSREKLEKMRERGLVRARKPTKFRTRKFMRRQHKAHEMATQGS
ncbi:HCP-like protein [Dioscorea alata]|uniref:HCP-like protein n=1 Tax=Dioscorea alata TaxID=55571 RepID=A0ACB7U4X9_DIOAL|nr:HCP-like protein [Dioscorea alata]